jgi:hypothetical protein
LYVLPSISCVLCFCIVLFIVSPHVYSCFSICVQFTDHCQLVENQMHSLNIISYIYHASVLHVFGNTTFMFILDTLNN